MFVTERSGATGLPGRPRSVARSVIVYAIVVGLPVAGSYLLVRDGLRLGAPRAGIGGQVDGPVFRLLLAVLVVLLVAHGAGLVARRLGQPRLVGEMIAGVALGPTVLGALAPGVQHALFDVRTLGMLDTAAQFGVVLFMFVVGLELPLPLLRRGGPATLIIGHGTIAGPFMVGIALAFVLPASLRPAGVSMGPYALFMGLALSVTALPVLARILEECGLTRTRVGAIGVSSAAICDVTAWSILAFVVVLARGGTLSVVARTCLLTLGFVLLMWFAVRPVLARLACAEERGRVRSGTLVVVCLCLVVASALATDAIGVHMIFGAFMAGVVAPRTSRSLTDAAARLNAVAAWFLLPIFFGSIGLRTDISAGSGPRDLAICAAIAIVAVAAKFGATLCSARLAGLDRRDTVDLSAMMTCRGLTELLMLNIGLSLGLVGERLFGMLVVMAIGTTLLASVVLTYRNRVSRRSPGGSPGR